MSNKYEQYEHHGNMVWARSDLKGTHREHCLCYQCGKFSLVRERNCVKANALFAFSVLTGMTTPVFECPDFKEAIK